MPKHVKELQGELHVQGFQMAVLLELRVSDAGTGTQGAVGSAQPAARSVPVR